jgi:hypothetical protein
MQGKYREIHHVSGIGMAVSAEIPEWIQGVGNKLPTDSNR